MVLGENHGDFVPRFDVWCEFVGIQIPLSRLLVQFVENGELPAFA
jgi:hypothetical protein